MSLIKQQLDSTKKAGAPQQDVVRKVKTDPVKVLLRWVYWLVMVGVIGGVVVTSVYTGLSMYKGLH